MDKIAKPGLTRLARQAGVKSMADDCHVDIKQILENTLRDVIDNMMVVNSEHHTKTVMVDDVYGGLSLMGYNVSQSSEINSSK